MSQPIFFSASQLRELLPLERLASSLGKAFADLSRNKAAHSPRHVMEIDGGALGMMGGAGTDFVGAKVVCVLPGNKARGLNPHQGIVALFDPDTGACLALADASMITALRTAALSLAATEMLAKKRANVLTVVGSGLQAELHIEAMLKARALEEVRIVARTQEKAEALAAKLKKNKPNLQISTGTELARFLPGTDLLCLCTGAAHPYLLASELPDGIHVNAIGACRPGMKEIELNIRDQNHLFFVESIQSAREEAEELRNFLLGDRDQVQEIGNLFLDKCIGRTDTGQVTFFKSVGVGLADVCALKLAYERAP